MGFFSRLFSKPKKEDKLVKLVEDCKDLFNATFTFKYLPLLLEKFENNVYSLEEVQDKSQWKKEIKELYPQTIIVDEVLPEVLLTDLVKSPGVKCLLFQYKSTKTPGTPIISEIFIDTINKKTYHFTAEVSIFGNIMMCGVEKDRHNIYHKVESIEEFAKEALKTAQDIVNNNKHSKGPHVVHILNDSPKAEASKPIKKKEFKNLSFFGNAVIYNNMPDEVLLDNEKAVAFLTDLEEKGVIDASTDLFTVYWFNMQDYNHAVEALEKNRKSSNPSLKSLWNLGVLYLQGAKVANNPLRKNIKTAIAIFEEIMTLSLQSGLEEKREIAIERASLILSQLKEDNVAG